MAAVSLLETMLTAQIMGDFTDTSSGEAKTAPRSREALWNSIGSIVGNYTPSECTNYLQNRGYTHSG
jgi:hypothetical protein